MVSLKCYICDALDFIYLILACFSSIDTLTLPDTNVELVPPYPLNFGQITSRNWHSVVDK